MLKLSLMTTMYLAEDDKNARKLLVKWVEFVTLNNEKVTATWNRYDHKYRLHSGGNYV